MQNQHKIKTYNNTQVDVKDTTSSTKEKIQLYWTLYTVLFFFKTPYSTIIKIPFTRVEKSCLGLSDRTCIHLFQSNVKASDFCQHRSSRGRWPD